MRDGSSAKQKPLGSLGYRGNHVHMEKGLAQRVCRNPIMKSFSVVPKIAFKILDEIYEETKPNRSALVSRQQISAHSSDNYNQYHPHSIQVSNKAGIMHLGMIYNIIRCKEWVKPVGTIYRDPSGKLWVVESSKLKSYFTYHVYMREKEPFN